MIEPVRNKQPFTFSPDAIRWYDRTGQVVEKVPSLAKSHAKKPLSDRPLVKVDIKKAKHYGLLPSVTSIVKGVTGYNEGLLKWIVQDRLRVAAENPYDLNSLDVPTPTDEERESHLQEWMADIERMSREFLFRLADRGKELHKYVNQYFANGTKCDDPAGRCIIDKISKTFEKWGVDEVRSELTIVDDTYWYAGTPDLVGLRRGELFCIPDLKTRGPSDLTTVHDSEMYQLGAYSPGENCPSGVKLVHFLACRDTGTTNVVVHNEDGGGKAEMWHKMFMNLYRNWCCIKDYYPADWIEGGE